MVTPAKATKLEAVLYLASLASNPLQIDPILDPVRQITARTDFKAEQLSTADQNQLQDTLTGLVTYLTTQEPVRAFTEADLDRRLQDRFEGSAAHRKLHITP